MRAVVYDKFGDESVLAVRDVAEPNPAPGEVKVAVSFASLNPVDFKLRAGLFAFIGRPKRPAITGGIGKSIQRQSQDGPPVYRNPVFETAADRAQSTLCSLEDFLDCSGSRSWPNFSGVIGKSGLPGVLSQFIRSS